MLEDLGRTVSVYDVVPLLAKRWFERSSEGKLLRKAYVSGEVARHGGIAICVTVSARAEVREAARAIVGADRFLEVHVDVPPDISAARRSQRTKKAPLLKRIRRSLRRLRGSESGYQIPVRADLTIDTVTVAPEENARALLRLLVERGFIEPSDRVRAELAPLEGGRGNRAAVVDS
jgi:sulfate adenylyltransferase